jgi:hypothetical protein
MKFFLTIIGIFGSLIASHAQSTFTSDLAGNQEVPPNSSPGYGSADFTFSGTTLTVTDGSYNDLLGNSSTVRLADAAAGANGPTIYVFTLTSPGTTSGTFTGSDTALTAGQITDLLAGNLYINITSSVYPSGEARGQLEAVPEPSTLVLAISGSLALLAGRRGKV